VALPVVDVSRDVDVTFRAIGPVEFKGSSGPIELHAASRHT
jgi:hypothetical protein